MILFRFHPNNQLLLSNRKTLKKYYKRNIWRIIQKFLSGFQRFNLWKNYVISLKDLKKVANLPISLFTIERLGLIEPDLSIM